MVILPQAIRTKAATNAGELRIVAAMCFLCGVLLVLCIYEIPRADETGRAVVNNDVAVEYGVYETRKEIIVATGLAPNKILERDGRVMTGMTVWARGRLPLTLYREATAGEVTLWKKYFDQ